MLVITAAAPSNLSTRGSVAIDCKTVGFFSKSVKKSVKRGVRVLRARSARASHAPVSLSVFSFVPDLLFDCSRVLEYAKIRTVLQSTVARAPVCSAGATLVTSISREVARERQVKGKARERARALTTPLTALPLASTISRGSHRLS